MNSYDTLSSFQEGLSWIEEAEKQIQEARDIRNRLSLETSRIKENIAEAENIRQNKSFLQRNLGSRKEENDLKKNYKEGIEEINNLDQIVNAIKTKFSGIAKNQKEQVEILRELNLQKKELNIQKRVVNESIRQVNASARKARATWTGVRGKGIIGSVARLSRMSVTQERENALTPLEAKKAEIERKLSLFDREILRVSKITGKDEPPTLADDHVTKKNKCQYCGRELGLDSVCLGCGAAN